VSQRRNIITLYKGNIKYVLRDTNQVLNKANQAIQVLEKYKAVFNQAINNLTILEFEDLVTVYDVAKIIQKVEMIERIEEEIERYILELGNEGRLITMQMEEIMSNVKEDKMNIIKDYWYHNQEKSYQKINEEIMNLSSEELLNLSNIARIFGYDNDNNSLDMNIYPKGYRILNKIPRISSGVLENVIKMFGSLQRILKASVSELDLAEGVGEIRAKIIKEGLKRYQDQVFIERHII
jgi:diadenylate cyclase